MGLASSFIERLAGLAGQAASDFTSQGGPCSHNIVESKTSGSTPLYGRSAELSADLTCRHSTSDKADWILETWFATMTFHEDGWQSQANIISESDQHTVRVTETPREELTCCKSSDKRTPPFNSRIGTGSVWRGMTRDFAIKSEAVIVSSSSITLE